MFITHRLSIGNNVNSKRYPQNSFGLQICYVGSFKDEEWRMNATQIFANSPKDNLSGSYGHLF